MTLPQADDAPTEGPYSIRAVQRVCDLLDLLQHEPDGVTLMHAAEIAKLPKSSAFRYLATLEERRYAERDPATGAFRLGLALLPMQARQLDVLTRIARPHLERLRSEFQETANLGLLDGHRVIYLDIVESPHTMRLAARPGDRDPLHATALGKAIAAQLPAAQVREILKAAGMPRHTSRTVTTHRGYLAALEEVRSAGFALDDGENEVGARCVAVALPNTALPLAISVSAPAARLAEDRVAAVAERLKGTAAQLASELTPADGNARRLAG